MSTQHPTQHVGYTFTHSHTTTTTHTHDNHHLSVWVVKGRVDNSLFVKVWKQIHSSFEPVECFSIRFRKGTKHNLSLLKFDS